MRESIPLLSISGKLAATNHVIADAHSLFMLAHGRVTAVLHSPTHAITTGYGVMLNVTSPRALRCVLRGGDILVVPSLWSRAFVSHSESVAIVRRFYWR